MRLEHKLQTRLKVVAIIDPAIHRSKQVKEAKCATFVEKAYENAKLCKDLDEFVKGMTPEEKPNAIIIGSPAQFHGSNLWVMIDFDLRRGAIRCFEVVDLTHTFPTVNAL